MSMHIALACGGTGGHIMPGLATANVLRARGHRVVLWMTGRETESASARAWAGELVQVPAEGLPNGVSLAAVRTAWKLWRAAQKCRSIMRKQPPDVLLAMGSYASAGPLWSARSLRIPFVLHEANVRPGRAVSFFSRSATIIACSFEETRYYLPGREVEVTGMPIRQELDPASFPVETISGHERNEFTLLVMGGSGGARMLNELAVQTLSALAAKGVKFRVFHLTGAAEETQVREQYRAAGVEARVHAFVQHIAPLYRAADLAICRAGASSCAELSAFGVPALLVPYPYAARDHQTYNARALEKIGAVDVALEKDLSAGWLLDYIEECMRNPGRLARMSAALKARAQERAAHRLADAVERAARMSPLEAIPVSAYAS